MLVVADCGCAVTLDAIEEPLDLVAEFVDARTEGGRIDAVGEWMDVGIGVAPAAYESNEPVRINRVAPGLLLSRLRPCIVSPMIKRRNSSSPVTIVAKRVSRN